MHGGPAPCLKHHGPPLSPSQAVAGHPCTSVHEAESLIPHTSLQTHEGGSSRGDGGFHGGKGGKGGIGGDGGGEEGGGGGTQ